MVDRTIVVRRNVVDPLLEGEVVDDGIEEMLVEQLAKEKILSTLLLSNVSDEVVKRMTERVAEADREAFKLYALTLIDQAKAAQGAKRRRVESEQEEEDFDKFKKNIQDRLGPDVKVPATLVPPYRLLNRLSSSPFDHIAAPELLASAASTERRGIQQAEDVNTGKAVSVRTGKSRKITSLAQYVEFYIRWCTGIFKVCGKKS
ncbi:hypothetical protein Pmar_PMAR022822 [Perkinsus marinus ATCC 50983]|uniref:Uncharacterized protein n=1 Tax=Perkinsus marinus (strain ATCC 50983 / TXsc) TaxID=423536 RepID=C5K4H8_PERM5|nr:hypothetical protein Pmar_PMAR022822 [Perkinsus marinus ATCC 50983]EER20615.1 hypothetical protein Pmar_PMAR022822 [Perkinsus marinus ATCC 50983]|eukprot:XP_002788819.1 hypothetical protein Pmar_PMAR022822 [Perkinsus marinus ATCC 50983]